MRKLFFGVPAYNKENNLERCINSLVNEVYFLNISVKHSYV